MLLGSGFQGQEGSPSGGLDRPAGTNGSRDRWTESKYIVSVEQIKSGDILEVGAEEEARFKDNGQVSDVS